MARIPITDIPNVPQIQPGPVLTPGVGGNISLAGAAQAYQQDTMNLGAFSGAARGLEVLGEAARPVADVLQNFALEMQQIQDEGSLAKADRLYGEAFAQHEIEMATKPPQEWASSWAKKETALRKELESLPLSMRGKVAADTFHSRFMSTSTVKLGVQANKKIIDDTRLEVRTNAKRKYDAGDFNGTMDIIHKSTVYSDAEKEALAYEFEEMNRKDMLAEAIDADPHGFIQNLDEGKIEVPKSEELQLRAQANRVAKQQVAEADDELDQLVLTGEVKTEDEVRKWGEARGLPERQILSHLESLSVVNENTEEGQALIQSARAEIQADISNYDPTADANDKSYFSIKDKIRANLPAGLRQEFLSDISAMRREGRKTPEQEIKANVFSQIRTVASTGFFGDPSKLSKGKKRTELELQIAQKENALMDQFRAYQKQIGPKMTQADADAWLHSQISGDVKKHIGETAIKPKTVGYMQSGGILGGPILGEFFQKKTQAELAAEIDKELQLPEK